MVPTLASVLSDHDLSSFAISTPSGSTVSGYSRRLNDATSNSPALVLVHGYPQTYVAFWVQLETLFTITDILQKLHVFIPKSVLILVVSLTSSLWHIGGAMLVYQSISRTSLTVIGYSAAPKEYTTIHPRRPWLRFQHTISNRS